MIPFERARLDWLRQARSESIGSTTFAYLIATYGSASSAIEHLPELARRGGRAQSLRIPTAQEAEDVLRVLDAQPGVSVPETPSPGPIDGAADVLDDADLQRLESLHSLTSTRLDDLAHDAAGAPSSAVAAALVELSLAGRAERLPGGFAVRR